MYVGHNARISADCAQDRLNSERIVIVYGRARDVGAAWSSIDALVAIDFAWSLIRGHSIASRRARAQK
jgi:hypothetical protein